MNTYIIVYNHRHGTDAWLHQSDELPDLEEIAAALPDFEPDRDEYLEWVAVEGKWVRTA